MDFGQNALLETRLQALVTTLMIHRCKDACFKTDKNVCKRGYPKESVLATFVDVKGFVHYRRADEDNRIVPYNPTLLLKFGAHINVEVAATVNTVVYLYKYLYKGPIHKIVPTYASFVLR